jgi:ceramide glucosyltransferase
MESLTIALDFIPSVLVARRLEGITFGLGASLLISKDALEAIGGLPAIADHLADDYQIGNRLWKQGYKIVLSHAVIENVVGPLSISDYWLHQVRWARTIRASRPLGYLGYGVTHLFPFTLLFALFQGLTVFALCLIGASLCLRVGLALLLYAKEIRSKAWLKWIVLLPMKDVASFCIWVWSLMRNKVMWRKTVYTIKKDGTMMAEASHQK